MSRARARALPAAAPAAALAAALALALLALAAAGCGVFHKKDYSIGELSLGMSFADVKKITIKHDWGLEEAALQDDMKPYRIFEHHGDPKSTILFRLAFRAGSDAKPLELVGIKALRNDGDDKIIDEWSARLGDPSEDDSGEFYTWAAEGEEATFFSRKDGKVVWVVYNQFANKF